MGVDPPPIRYGHVQLNGAIEHDVEVRGGRAAAEQLGPDWNADGGGQALEAGCLLRRKTLEQLALRKNTSTAHH